MAGIIGKFVRGAAKSGAESFRQQAQQEAQAERDQRLSDLRARRDEASRQHQTERDERSFEQQKELVDYKAERMPGDGVEPTANQKDVAAMVNAGVFDNERQAWDFLNSKGQSGSIVRMYEALQKKQEDAYLEPGDKGYKSPKDLLKEAESMVSNLNAPSRSDESGGDGVPTFSFGGQGGQGGQGGSQAREAPSAAVEFLQSGIESAQDETERKRLLDQFQSKYGYLPAPYAQQ